MYNKKMMQAAQSSQGSVDLISYLPQDVMNLVLMCLPIREAIGTSILSKKWRYKWISIPDIVFNEDCLMEDASVKEHANAVDHVLLNHVGSIRKFSCMFYVPSCSHIDGWIMFLSRNPITKLILKIRGKDYYDAPFISKEVFYDVPSHIFYYQELCHLELLHCTLNVPYTFKGFRNLRVLNLESFKIGCLELAFLILGSPLLERLTLKDLCIYGGVLIISAPNLRYLEVDGKFEELSLEGPHLTHVSIYLCCGDLERDKTCNLIRFIGRLHAIERFALKGSFLKFLSIGDVPEKLPATYNHLNYLEVDIEMSPKEILAILCILRSAPNLIKLKIKYCLDPEHVRPDLFEEEAEFWGAKEQFDCLLSHLHAVEIIGLAMLLDLELVRFILSNAPVLKTMKIYTHKSAEVEEVSRILNELLRFQRVYARAEIIYLGHYKESK